MAKRKHVSIETKVAAINEVEKCTKSKTEVAQIFGVSLSTLSAWLKNKETILQSQNDFGPERKRLRTAKHPDVEAALLMWLKNARSENVPLSGPVLQAKAQDLAKDLDIDDLHVSGGWLSRFKQRHNIVFRINCGEAGAVSTEQTDQWATTTLPKLLKDYQPRDIFNADESGLFFRLLPSKSLVIKGDDCHVGNRSKDRLSILPCANMDGSEKLPMLVIGKATTPRCFKGVKTLPTEYRANKRAWMTSDIFTDWIRAHDRRFALQRRKVAMVIDTCPSHPPITGLKAIKLIFLPPNATSKTQPMDQGIIANIKHHYRSLILQKLISDIDNKKDFSINVLEAMRFIQQAWSMVKPATVSWSFAHCGFVAPTPPVDESDDPGDDLPLATLMTRLRETGYDVESTADEYLAADENLVATEALTDEDINGYRKLHEKDEDRDALDNDVPAPAPPSTSAVLDMCQQMRAFFESKENSSKFFEHLNGMEQFVRQQQLNTRKRTPMNDHFS